MSQPPKSDLKPNTYAYETEALVTPNGFREYDARWLFGKEINLLGVQALGLGLGTYHPGNRRRSRVVTGHDYRSYSLSIKQALMLGLMRAGCEVMDIGLATTPMAYFAQFELDVSCRCDGDGEPQRERLDRREDGREAPLTFGPDEMNRLKTIVLDGEGKPRAGGSLTHVSQNFASAISKP